MANKNVVFVVLTTTGGSFSIHVHITCCATGFRMLNNNKVIYTTTTTTELKIPENWPTQYPASSALLSTLTWFSTQVRGTILLILFQPASNRHRHPVIFSRLLPSPLSAPSSPSSSTLHPPHSLHVLRSIPCSHKPDSPHSLHL